MTVLLDANVLIAVVVADHVHHAAAAGWLRGRTFATCPITQGALVRLLVREGFPGAEARTVLERVTAAPAHEFWPDGIGYDRVDLRGVVGHRQVTDAYLASLARLHAGALATFVQGLAALHADVAELLTA